MLTVEKIEEKEEGEKYFLFAENLQNHAHYSSVVK